MDYSNINVETLQAEITAMVNAMTKEEKIRAQELTRKLRVHALCGFELLDLPRELLNLVESESLGLIALAAHIGYKAGKAGSLFFVVAENSDAPE